MHSAKNKLKKLIDASLPRIFQSPVEYGVKMVMDNNDTYDYTCDLPLKLNEIFKTVPGYRNKSTISSISEELRTILLPNKLIKDVVFLNNHPHFIMNPEFWIEAMQERVNHPVCKEGVILQLVSLRGRR
jgi:hypothetical protein